MAFIENIRSFIISQLIRNKKRNKQLRFTDLERANSIGIIFKADNPNNNQTIVSFANQLKNSNKDIQLLGYIHKRDEQLNYPFPFISDKELTWYGKPGGGTVGYFIRNPFDILINFTTNNCLPLNYIAAVSAAKFRVGFNQSEALDYYDFMLVGNEKDNANNLIYNLNKYLH